MSECFAVYKCDSESIDPLDWMLFAVVPWKVKNTFSNTKYKQQWPPLFYSSLKICVYNLCLLRFWSFACFVSQSNCTQRFFLVLFCCCIKCVLYFYINQKKCWVIASGRPVFPAPALHWHKWKQTNWIEFTSWVQTLFE